MEKNYKVYAHYISSMFNPFYIGMGHNFRWKSSHGRNNEWHRITDESKGFNWRILAEDLSKSDALELEALVIETYGKENLCNIGGMTGRKHTEDSKAKMRASTLGQKRPDNIARNKARKGMKYKKNNK